MRLRISHRTSYDYDQPVPYALQQVRLTPRDCAGQHVLHWQTRIEGGAKELSFDDQHGNRVDLVSLSAGTRTVTVIAEGEVETRDVRG